MYASATRSEQRASCAKKGLTAQRVIVNRLNPDYIRRGEMYAAQTVALTLDMPLLGEIPEDAKFTARCCIIRA